MAILGNIYNVGVFSATGSGTSVKIQETISRVVTNSAYTPFVGLPQKSGVLLVIGFLYPDKDYGGGFYASNYAQGRWSLSGGTISTTDFTQ